MSVHEVSDDGVAMVETGSVIFESPEPIAECFVPKALPQPTQPTRTFFGLAQDSQWQGFPRPAFNDDYVARFPVDPYGQEAAPNARVWRVYVEQAAAFDENMIGQSRDGLDVMLVFAGLFSAVVTSFLVQASQNLQADFSEMSALLLYDLLVVDLAVANGATVNVTTPSIDPTAKFDPDAIDVWINGLWVVSLTTSLVVALTAVLVKQWLHRYMTFPSGTPGLRSHVRQFRFMGLEKWRVRIMVGMLPIVMHISLMLFFAGLALFYVPLRASLAAIVGTITVLVCVLYLISNTIPIIFPQCPYQTPLTEFIHHVCQIFPVGVRSIRHYCLVAYRGIRKRLALARPPSSTASPLGSDVLQSNMKSLTQLESDAVRDAHDTLSVDALDWLYRMSSNPTVHTLVLQSFSGLPAASRSCALKKWDCATDMQDHRQQLLLTSLPSLDSPDTQWMVERLCLSFLFLPVTNIDLVALRDILHRRFGHWDPCIEVALRLGCGWSYDYSGFFVAHPDARMRPLVWEEVVRQALDQCNHPEWPEQENKLVQILSIVIPPADTPPDYVSSMTGPEFIWKRLQPQFWDSILKTSLLVPFDSVPGEPISSYHRTVIAAGRLALSGIPKERDSMGCFTKANSDYLDLLDCVVKRIVGLNHREPAWFGRPAPASPKWTVNFDFLITVLEEFQDVFSLSIESYNSSTGRVLLCLHRICWNYRSSSDEDFEFHFPQLDRFLQFWARFYDCVQSDSVFRETRPGELRETPIAVMSNALSRGHEEAYRIFASGGWMEIIFTEWATCGDGGWAITSYIKGLYTTTLTHSNRCQFGKYLFQPSQLTLALMLMVATYVRRFVGDGCFNSPSPFLQLAKICPTHTVWSDCDAALKAILAWVQTSSEPEISLFPWPPCLSTTSDAFRRYPLVEWTARRFATDRDTEEKLEAALDALHGVLENAERVDGVLIPNLENLTQHLPR